MVTFAFFITWLLWRLRYIQYPIIIVLIFYVSGVVLGFDGFWLQNLIGEFDIDKIKRSQSSKIRLDVLIEALESVRMLQGKDFEPVLEKILMALQDFKNSPDNKVHDFTIEEFYIFIKKLNLKDINLTSESDKVAESILQELSKLKWIYWNNPPMDEICYFLKGSLPKPDEKKENLAELLNNLRYSNADEYEIIVKERVTANCDNFDINILEFEKLSNYELIDFQPSTWEFLTRNPDISFYFCCFFASFMLVVYFLDLFEPMLYKSYPTLYKFLFYFV